MGGGVSKTKLLEVEERAARAEREAAEERQRTRDATQAAEKNAAAEVAKKVAAAEAQTAKKVADASKKVDNAYKALSRFNLLGAVQEQDGGTRASPSSEDVSLLREAIKTGDADAAKVFLDLRGGDGKASQSTRERKPLSELDIELEDVVRGAASDLGVSISGVGSGRGDMRMENGTYFPVPGEKSGGKPVYKEVQRDAWIEFSSGLQTWQVKPGKDKGTDICWMQAREKCGNTNTVDQVTCGWNAYNASTKKWEEQPEVRVEAVYVGPPLHCAAMIGVAGTCRVLLDACEGLATCVDRSGLTARQLAEEKGHTEVVQAIDDWIELKWIKDARQMQTEETETALRMAAQHNDVSTLQDLLRQGVDPFAQDEAGDTALHLAVSKGHVPAVFHILSSEAAKDVTRWSLRNKCGRTAGELAVFLGFSAVSEEIDRHKLKRMALMEEQHTTLASRVQLKIRACQEECARLQAALAEVEARCEEYTKMYTEGAKDCILSVEHFRELVQTVLTRDKGAGTHSPDAEERFNSQAETLVCGEFADAANGLIELLQVDEDTLIDKVRGGLEALELEIKMFGDEETIAIFDYVVKQKTSEKEYPNGIRDQDREEECLADFAKHGNSHEAKLNECELASLRMYTLPTFKHINNPLRDQERVRAGQFHPLAVLTEHLTRALKKLRRIDSTRDAATKALTLWRGMKDLTVSEQYSSTGGTELAPMSTTCDFKTAVDFCMSANSLIFCIQTQNKLQRGVDLAWISAFPGESEVLFPPLTYMQPTGRRQVVEVDGMRFTIVEVNPTIA